MTTAEVYGTFFLRSSSSRALALFISPMHHRHPAGVVGLVASRWDRRP